MQGGVGEAGCAVEDGAAEEHHVEPLDDRAAGQAVEESLLVEAAGCGSRGSRRAVAREGVLQALVADDELGFHGGVLVVLLDPAGEAFGEGVVVEGVGEFGDGAVDLDDLVDGAGVAGRAGGGRGGCRRARSGRAGARY